MSGSETHLQIYLDPWNISLVFLCIVRYQPWKKALETELGPAAPQPLREGAKPENPLGKVLHFEYVGNDEQFGCRG
jgi:hypothetical protein